MYTSDDARYMSGSYLRDALYWELEDPEWSAGAFDNALWWENEAIRLEAQQ